MKESGKILVQVNRWTSATGNVEAEKHCSIDEYADCNWQRISGLYMAPTEFLPTALPDDQQILEGIDIKFASLRFLKKTSRNQ